MDEGEKRGARGCVNIRQTSKFIFDRRYLNYEKILACILAAFMLLAAVACTANTAPNDPKSDTTDNNTDTPAVTMTAQDILDSLKKSLWQQLGQ